MLSRRELLMTGAAGVAAATVARRATAQTPKRGGALSLRLWDPPHFDHILAHAYRTHVLISFTHSRLVRHKAGPSVAPGAFPIEGDLAESWQQVNDTTYVFKLKKGVRFHAKAPVNGRELTADDVRYTFERILTEKGSAAVSMYRSIAKVEATDRYTVKFTLKEPFAWFLDMIANPMTGAIIARECVEKFGDLKKPEAVIGTGPWMLDAYKPNQSLTLVRNPNYFVAGLPLHRPGRRRHRRGQRLPHRRVPGRQVRSRLGEPGDHQPLGLGADRRDPEDASARPQDRGVHLERGQRRRSCGPTSRPSTTSGCARPSRSPSTARASSTRPWRAWGWSTGRCRRRSPTGRCPSPSWARARSTIATIPAEARRLLAAAGHPKGFPASVCFATYGSTQLVDQMQLVLKYLKDVGIDAKLDQKEYGAYQATCRLGKFESMGFGPLTPFLEPDNFLFGQYYTGEPRNRSHVADPALDDLLVRQRRTADVKARREVIHQIQRHLAKQQYYVHVPSQVYIAVWDGALKNYGPNLGFDYGGRLAAAWLDR